MILNIVAKRRWYDSDTDLAQCILWIEQFPVEIRHIVANGLIYMAEKQANAHAAYHAIKSLGTDVVLSLYRSKLKRRELDQDPAMHLALNYLLILTPENRRLMVAMTQELLTYIAQYMKSSHLARQQSSTDDILQLTNVFVKEGGKKAQQLLQALEKKFAQAIRQASARRPDIKGGESGMRIKKDPDMV